MDHNNKYDVYITELTNLDAEFKNFIQLNNSCDIATMQKYPFGSVLNGKKFSDVLASMSYFPKPTSKDAMRALAEQVSK